MIASLLFMYISLVIYSPLLIRANTDVRLLYKLPIHFCNLGAIEFEATFWRVFFFKQDLSLNKTIFVVDRFRFSLWACHLLKTQHCSYLLKVIHFLFHVDLYVDVVSACFLSLMSRIGPRQHRLAKFSSRLTLLTFLNGDENLGSSAEPGSKLEPLLLHYW